ncbi:MAG: insulinase family protein [Candidatus Limivivens sp.]|nr:insulinase family protein [Candidatus Limivivens sp.]
MKTYNLQAYDLIKQESIPDIQSEGFLFKHKKSGARICVLSNSDENKVFHIAFRTPTPDSTGVAHILEHSTLCGSRKFPSKDPFVELVKGSLNTFLNAMTYPDKTMYPVASCNDKDFANLMHVYMDAVFYPNIYRKEEIFCQEGWNYHLESPEGELTYNGVVYNEMKGAYSSAEDVLDREILRSLYPDTTYTNDSGGDPACIPDLTYENFLNFHRTYYHPSNCYIYLYGNLDVEERLEWLDREYLSDFEKAEVNSEIALQKPFTEMAEVRRAYSISNSDSLEHNTYLAWNASISTSADVRLANAFAVIEYALLSAPGAPLKQALLDAGFGKDIMGSYDSGTLQPVFSVTAKYADVCQKDAFVGKIQEVLKEIVEKGLDEKAIFAGINYMEFRFREADFGSYPKGLMYGIDLMDSWLYDETEPFVYLKQLEVFAYLKQQVGTGYYEGLIQTWLIDNRHTSLVVIEPEKGLSARIEEQTRQELAAYKAGLSGEEIQKLVEKTEKLLDFQETPSTKEELEAIPMLTRADIRRETYPLFNTEKRVDDTLVLHHEVFTNGIAYLNLMFDLRCVPAEDVPYLGILKAALGMMDTEHYTYGELFNEINRCTGGISAALDSFENRKEPGKGRSFLEIRGKALYDKLPFVFEMIQEILFTTKLGDEKRLREILAEQKSRLQMRLPANGHVTTAVRAMAYFSESAAMNDAVSGITYYKLIEDLEEHFEERKEALIGTLQKLMGLIFRKENLMVSYTSDAAGYQGLEKLIMGLKEKLPEGQLPAEEKRKPLGIKNEGFLTASKIQYVCRAGNFRKAGLSYTGALRILKVIMSYEYLWTNIRVKGGAYGCMSGFGYGGNGYFTSYRDPNLGQTNQVYEGIPDYVRNFTVDERDMTKYVIGTISEMDTPLNPSAVGSRSLTAWMSGYTEADYQKERDQVLDADQESIRALAPIVEAILKEGAFCVVGGEEKLEQEKALFKELKPLIGGMEDIHGE